MPEPAERPPRAFALAPVLAALLEVVGPGRIAVAALLVAPAAGCQGEVRATLVALQGCGLDGAELSSLELVARGDFPSDDATRADHGLVRLPDLPEDVVAITVEGKFGDLTEAVGRTARLDVEGDIPVYFAPADELCSFPSGIENREVGAMGIGPEGDVLLVGGRDGDGRLLDDVIRTRDVEDVVSEIPGGLSVAVTGLVLAPLAERRFVTIGGARSDGTVLDTWVPIDLAAPDPIGPPTRIRVDGLDDAARTYHAIVGLPDGRSLVTGGCRMLDLDARCIASPTHVVGSAFLVDPTTDPPSFVRAPAHLVARFDHTLLVARDGVVFAVGGRGANDRGVITIERWRPGANRWESYGPTAELDLAPDEWIVGATLLEGGLVVVATSAGGIGWVSETAADRWWQPGDATFTWCDGDPTTAGCFHDESLDPPPPPVQRRRLLALPDERVLADAFLLPIGHVGQGPVHAVDLTLPTLSQAAPPDPRVGAALGLLADGTVLFAGGRNPDTLDPVAVFLLRFRPDLQGPDERIPNIADLRAGSFVAHDPATLVMPTPTEAQGVDRVFFQDEQLQLNSMGDEADIPEVWAHVRSFRSASFRFDVTIEMPVGGRPHLILSHGAVARTSIRFGDRIEGVQRAADGSESPFTCSLGGLLFDKPQALRFDVTPEKIVIKAAGDAIASCPGVGDMPSALGLGVSGPGVLRASRMQLTRI